MERILLSVNELSECLGIGRDKVYDILKSSDLEVVRLGRRTLITRRSVDAFIDRLACPSMHGDEWWPIRQREAA